MSEIEPGVIELVAERIRSDSQPYQRDDPYKVGIISQGGAMRGCGATGFNVALESLMGDSEPFDRADNTSAGGFHWAALQSRKMAECTSIYYEELSRGFINLHHIPHAIWAYRRGREGRKIVDLSLLIDAVSDGEKAFDFDRILNHPTETTAYASLLPDILPVEFKIGAKALQGTDTQTTSKHVVNCRSREDILLGLNATALLPFLAGSAITLPDGRRLVDGGVAAGRIPLEQAIHAGCTHILVMVTDKNIPVAQMQRSKQERFAVKRLLRQYPDIEPVRYWHGHEIHKQTTAKLRQAESGGLQKPKITVVRIPDALITGSNETDPNKLFRAARAGEEVMHKLFQPYDLKRDTSITVRPSRIGRK